MADLDPSLLDSIKGFEGFSASPNWDYKQYSNGYGTKATGPDESIDETTAHQRLSDEVSRAADKVDSLGVQMPPGARNALISLTYNAGPGWMQSGLGDLVRAGDWTGARDRFLQYNKAGGETNPGLVKRRTAEAAWFDQPQQTAQQSAPQPTPAFQQIPPAQAPMNIAPFAQSAPAPQQQQQSPSSFYSMMPASPGQAPQFPPEQQMQLAQMLLKPRQPVAFGKPFAPLRLT